jgi:hypothetical protein
MRRECRRIKIRVLINFFSSGSKGTWSKKTSSVELFATSWNSNSAKHGNW